MSFCSEDDVSGGASGLIAAGLRRVSREHTLQLHAFNATVHTHTHTHTHTHKPSCTFYDIDFNATVTL